MATPGVVMCQRSSHLGTLSGSKGWGTGEWLKEPIPRFVAQECRLFLEEKALLFSGPF
jgi:hypothetical protein